MPLTAQQSEAITARSKSFGGQLLRSGDDGYDEARRVHNGLIDKHPAVIATVPARQMWPMQSNSA